VKGRGKDGEWREGQCKGAVDEAGRGLLSRSKVERLAAAAATAPCLAVQFCYGNSARAGFAPALPSAAGSAQLLRFSATTPAACLPQKGPAVYRSMDGVESEAGGQAPVLEAYEHPRVKEARLQVGWAERRVCAARLVGWQPSWSGLALHKLGNLLATCWRTSLLPDMWLPAALRLCMCVCVWLPATQAS